MGLPTSILVMLFALLFIGSGLEFCSSTRSIHSNVSCIQSERDALFKFKQSLIDRPNRLSSWVGEDCCTWNGVGCSKRTGHVVKLDLRNPTLFDFDSYSTVDYDDYVANYSRTCLGGEINPSLLDLKHLLYIDLSMNKFSGIQIPEFLGSLKSLRYLNLSSAGFGGKVPHHLGNLSSLLYLDLSSIYLTVDSLWWASTLSSLKYLDLGGVPLGEVTDWLHAINMLPSLLQLNLAHCQLGTIPPLSHVNITSLASLDLHSNQINPISPPWLSNISDLMHLRLDHNLFHDSISIPIWLCKLSNLVSLDLSYNFLQGSIPRQLCNITQLTFLDLSGNNFSGEVPFFVENTPACLQSSLKELKLGLNKFTGTLPNRLGEFRNLEILDLNSNSFSGPFPESIGTLSLLRILDVKGNQLNGSIPSSFGQLSKLETLCISNNSLDGLVSELHFAKLTRLNELGMSLNSLVVNVSSKWVPPFQLRRIEMSSCKQGPYFPPWLQKQRRVKILIMSNASISDTIPDWFEDLYSRIYYLDLSHNQITGLLPQFQESDPSGRSRTLILNSNKFEGPLTPFPSDVNSLDFSNNLLSGHIPQIVDNRTLKLEALILSDNCLTGAIPEYLCKIETVGVIDLSRNQLSGRLLSCLGDLQGLKVLDLTNNSLDGDIPTSLGSLGHLISLHLHNNRFHGKLPSSLQNLSNLEILDLGENEFTDIIPPWIGEKLSNLKFLNLQSNKFNGHIPIQLCHLSALQLLNLAHNNITGNIPHCFQNFTAMVVNHVAGEYVEYGPNTIIVDHGAGVHVTNVQLDSVYKENIFDSIKGRDLQFTKTIPFLTSIDLSNNHIVGEIPEELMDLFGLRSLNLAGNHLKGRIPEKIGNLKQLETLDFSRNKLFGSIPPSLSALHYLSRLNLSFNNLSGRIPTGNQLQTLDDQSIYIGNDGLCGLPLLKSCPGDKSYDDHKHVSENKGGEESEYLWFFYAGIGPGFLVGFLGFCGILHFKKSWRYAFFQLVDNIYNRLVVAIEVKATWVRRKFHKGEFRA